MASFEKRGKKYRAIVSVMENGARRKVAKTFNTKKEATNWATLEEASKITGEFRLKSNITFVEYFEFWMNTYKKKNVRESSFSYYISVLHILKNIFGNIKLENLDYITLQMGLDKYGDSHSKATTMMLTSRVKACLKDAKFDEFIKKDIYSRLKPHGLTIDKPENVLPATDFEKLQSYLYKHYSEFNSNVIILIALETGMRIGEIMALQYKDVSSAFNFITVSKSFSSTIGKVTDPKNKNSFRKIKVTSELVSVIDPDSHDPEERINQLSHEAIRDQLRRLIKKLDLQPIRMHGLRHSHASYLLYKGVSINYVSKRLGHADTSITQKVYAHMLKEEQSAEQDKTMSILSSMSPNVPKRQKKG